MTPEEHLLRWQALHGVEPSWLVRRWLHVVRWLSRPLRVPPWSVTVAAVAVTASALVVPLPVAAGLVLLAGLLDGIDGCVAVLQDKASDTGRRLDHGADRIGELVFGGLLWRAGVPWWLAVTAVVLMLAVEGLRRSPVVTVGERPVRVLFTAAALLVWPVVWAWGLVALSGVAVAQLVRRERIVT
ncbi:MAG: CDP-alcohol phosphatidyltransferase family protein [Mycobacteriales bacterium]